MADSSRGVQRRMPSRDELRVWRNFIETTDALRRRLASRMQARSGLSSADYSVMLALSEAEEHTMRPSQLASLIGWERSRLSHHLGRMEQRDLIRRERWLGDSRGTLIVLTEEGMRSFRRGSVPHLRDIRELFVEAFTAERLAAVEIAVQELRIHLASVVEDDADHEPPVGS